MEFDWTKQISCEIVMAFSKRFELHCVKDARWRSWKTQTTFLLLQCCLLMGHSTTTWTIFFPNFDPTYPPPVDKIGHTTNWLLFFTSPLWTFYWPHPLLLVHVVIECTPNAIIFCRFYQELFYVLRVFIHSFT